MTAISKPKSRPAMAATPQTSHAYPWPAFVSMEFACSAEAGAPGMYPLGMRVYPNCVCVAQSRDFLPRFRIDGIQLRDFKEKLPRMHRLSQAEFGIGFEDQASDQISFFTIIQKLALLAKMDELLKKSKLTESETIKLGRKVNKRIAERLNA